MKIEINNKTVEIDEGQTILSAIKKLGMTVPTLCHIEGLLPSGACRMCVVEVEGERNLVPSCSAMARDGMKIKTHSPKVLNTRKTLLKLLLANHPDDCLFCDKNSACELQKLSEDLNVRQRTFKKQKITQKVDLSSYSITREPSKCILCGRCVRVCEEVQGVSAIDFIGRGSKSQIATAFNEGLNISTCVNCGQCIAVCPTGALSEKNNIKAVMTAINDPEMFVVVQHAPAISVTVGEYFGFNPGVDVCGLLTAGLRQAGFDKVFDTSFSADLTIMEEASELVHRIKTGGVLPMMTSCSPGWIKFVEQFYPEFIPNLSTCKSPQQMLGALIKNYYAQKHNIDPSKIFSVSIMPCTAKKFEAGREEMTSHGMADIDVSLTTRELTKILQVLNIDLNNLEPEMADNPFEERTSAGKIFGSTGGVMTAAIRTAYYMLENKEFDSNNITVVSESNGIKEMSVNIAGIDLTAVIVSGLGNARKVLEEIKKGKQYHFIEVMSCPGGCIAGGGQPFGVSPEKIKARTQALQNIDSSSVVRTSHSNESIQKLYKEFLGEPLGEKSHKLLHTKYFERKDTY